MKPFVVKPFVVNIDHSKQDMGKPHWKFYLLGASLLPWGVFCWIQGLLSLSDFSLALYSLALVIWCVGCSLIGFGRFVRETNKSREELMKRVAEQDERIRKLEEQLAAISAPRADR